MFHHNDDSMIDYGNNNNGNNNYQPCSSHRPRERRRAFRSMNYLFVLLCIVPLPQMIDARDGRNMFWMDETTNNNSSQRNNVFYIEIAKFGSQFPKSIDRINFMLPPTMEDDLLCKYPEALKNDTSINIISSILNDATDSIDSSGTTTAITNNSNVYTDTTTPIGLIVRRGECTVQQKASVLLDISKRFNITSTLKYLLVFEDDPTYLSTCITFVHEKEDAGETPPDELRDIGIAYLPFQYSDELNYIFQRNMVGSSDNNDTVPFLFRIPQNINWKLLFRISGPEDELVDNGGCIDSPTGNDGNRNPYATNFFLFRYLLFGILLLSPCFRAGYLWYAGGGRILFRRTNGNTGRIIGLQYIPPIPWWLTASRLSNEQQQQQANSNGTGPVKSTLTEEQFNALPEFTYQYIPTDDDNGQQCHDDDDVEIKNVSYHAPEQCKAEKTSSNTDDDGSNNSIIENDDAKKNSDMDDNVPKMMTATGPATAPRDDDEIIVPIVQQNVIHRVKSNDENDVEKQLERQRIIELTPKNNDDVVPSHGNHKNADLLDGADHYNSDASNIPNDTSDNHPIIPSNNDQQPEQLLLPSSTTSSNGKSCSGHINAENNASATTCTMCSICIDDFIYGEKLILLPNCKHAFHKECLHPWLLERQGCCPLCKTGVLVAEEQQQQEQTTTAPSSLAVASSALASSLPIPILQEESVAASATIVVVTASADSSGNAQQQLQQQHNVDNSNNSTSAIPNNRSRRFRRIFTFRSSGGPQNMP